MGKAGPGTTARRRPASGRPGGAPVAPQAVRMNLFVLVRILFQYLERVDKSVLGLAKEVLKDCERKHNSKDSKYETLADAIGERVRDVVGEKHWAQARRIQKQLLVNQQKKKMMAMKRARVSQEQLQSLQKGRERDEAMEAAEAMSAMRAAPAPSAGEGGASVPAQTPRLGAQPSSAITSNEAAPSPHQEAGGALPPRKRISFAPVPSIFTPAPTSFSLHGDSPSSNLFTSHK